MGKRFAAMLLLLSIGSDLAAQEPEPEESGDWPAQEHLVPVEPYASGSTERYNKLWHKQLQVPDRYLALMVRRPSFEPESCLAIFYPEDDIETYAVVLTRADHNLWDWIQAKDGGEPRARIEVKRFEATLPPKLAVRVLKLWERMLGDVHYPKPEDDFLGEDGESIEFRFRYQHGFRPDHYGETWSPVGGCARLLVDLGAAIADYCEAGEDERPERIEAIRRCCEALETRLEKK